MSSNYTPGTGSTTGFAGSATGSGTANAAQQIREAAGQIKDQAKNQAEQKFSQQKRSAVAEIENLAAALRQTAQTFQSEDGRTGRLLETAASRLERLSDKLDAQNLSRMVGDVDMFARRNPAAFLGTALAVGFIAARFLKATTRDSYGHEGDFETDKGYGTTGFESYGAGGYESSGSTGYGTTGGGIGYGSSYGSSSSAPRTSGGVATTEPWGSRPDTSEEL